MSYELRPYESFGKNLRRIFRQQIKSALAFLRGEKTPRDTVVHEIRKHLKKSRAVLRLAREQIGRREFRRQDKRLRNAGRLMREIRDAEVRLQTIRQLEDVTHHHYRSYQKIERLLAVELENFVMAFDGWREHTLALLEQANEAAGKWPKSRCGERQLRRVIQRTYKSGRKALAAARTHPSVANIHELRKHVKSLGYQISIIRPWNHLVIGAAHAELTDLGHLLGRIHDIKCLTDRLHLEQRETHWGKQDDELLKAAENIETALQRDGVELAERFFAERPRDFGAYIDELFADRRHASENNLAEELVAA